MKLLGGRCVVEPVEVVTHVTRRNLAQCFFEELTADEKLSHGVAVGCSRVWVTNLAVDELLPAKSCRGSARHDQGREILLAFAVD